MALPELNDRERRVLEAVIRSYVETAEPAGSRTISRRYRLGVSPATIRNTMSDLEEKGLLFHPHTSAGRVPTDAAYRVYVDELMRNAPRAAHAEQRRLQEELSTRGSAIEVILKRAAQTLGVLTQELGVALGPRFDETILQRLELVRLSAERLLMVLTLGGGGVRTIFVEVKGDIADSAITEVMQVLNDRLSGHSLRDIRRTLPERLRDSPSAGDAGELLNIFIQEGEQFFDLALARDDDDNVLLGQTSVLAEQPEFASGDNLRRLLSLTETRTHLAELLRRRTDAHGVTITIGNEHGDARFENLTVVTAEYHAGTLSGVIGVVGPTRMPYDKVIALVRHTSQLVSDLLD